MKPIDLPDDAGARLDDNVCAVGEEFTEITSSLSGTSAGDLVDNFGFFLDRDELALLAPLEKLREASSRRRL